MEYGLRSGNGMTDEEKLTILDNIEFGAWDKLSGNWTWLSDTLIPLKAIERCQRIRANLKDQFVPFPVTKVYSEPGMVTGEWIDHKWVPTDQITVADGEVGRRYPQTPQKE